MWDITIHHLKKPSDPVRIIEEPVRRALIPNITPTSRILPDLAHKPHGFFLAATHGSKMRLTSQGEHTHIRPSLKSSPADMRYYRSYCAPIHILLFIVIV